MKNVLFFLFLLAGLATQAQTNTATPASTDVLVLKQDRHDFGDIRQGRPVTHEFTVTNTGTKPLLLENVQASCGCTTPQWSKAPIKPGTSTTIKVGYNAASTGYFDKTVTIVYNNSQTKVIHITGTVFSGPNTSAPVNASLALLKTN